MKTDDELDGGAEDRLEAALRSLGRSGLVEGNTTGSVLDAMTARDAREIGEAEFAAARKGILAGALDRILSRSAQSTGLYAPGTPLGAYMRRVREVAAVDVDRWAARLGLTPKILRELERTDLGFLRITRPDTLAILLDEFEVPLSSFAEAIGAAAGRAAAPMRGGSGGELDGRTKARVDEIVSSVSHALLERDRSDLLA